MKVIHPLQTLAWADFRQTWGNEVLKTKYGYITLHKLPFINKKIGMFIRGPKPTVEMLSDLRQISTKHNLVFIKLEPFELKNKNIINLLKKHGAVAGRTLFTPTSFWINLTKPEGELVESFHKKTRYNIRYAARRGVTVEEDNSDKAFNTYIRLMKETVERQGFYAHSKKYDRG